MTLKDADALIREICRNQCERESKGCGSRCELVAYVDDMPTVDAVPVVRCKNCKSYKDGRCFFTMRRHGLHDDWFCADGERRGKDETD